MPLRTDQLDEPHLNLTPLIDVLIFLIIFFMLGTSFKTSERQHNVQLPTTSDAAPLTSRPDELSIIVRAGGDIELNDKKCTIEELNTELIKARTNYPDQSVAIRGEGTTPYQYVLNVLAACERAKITAVSLPVRLKPGARK